MTDIPATSGASNNNDASNSSSNDSDVTNSTAITETYIINENTHKFHKPSCSSVSKMNEANKKEYKEYCMQVTDWEIDHYLYRL